jgi:hypothetical protein
LSYFLAGYWILDTGYWILDTGYWILDTGYWILDTGYWILDTKISKNSELKSSLKKSIYQ